MRDLEILWRARSTAADTVPPRPVLDRMTRALAILLHETLHATGPAFPADLESQSGRAFEEGFTEAATIDLLPAAIRALKAPPPLTRALLVAARRYRPAYKPQVEWSRWLSLRTAPAQGRPAWRVAVADRYGEDRWHRLSAGTGAAVAELRAGAPPVAANAALH